MQGTLLILLGNFKNKSDFPPECMSYNFKNEIQIDYYSCE